MSKDKISDYSATANSNTDIGGINIDEGCAPSGINDAIRTLMKQLKDWQSGSQDVYIHPAGSASAPSITATGDTNTGVFFPAADTIGITTGGTERARVDSSGNLGVGTTSPLSKLHLNDSTGTAVNLIRMQTAWSNPSGNKSIVWADGTDVLGRISVSYSSPTAKMTFGSLYSSGYQTGDLMTLDASGNLGVGTTSPSGKLHVVGNTYAQGDIYFNTSTGQLSSGSGAWPLIFGINGTEKARIDSSGNLLVGTTTQLQAANSRLNVAGDFYNGNGVSLKTTNGGSGSQFVGFINDSGTVIGSINRVTTTNAVAYNTTSDVRLKSNIEDAAPVLGKLMQVQVRQYDWTEGNLHQDYGFIAQELEPVLSGVVTKGRTEEDVWQLDYSKLTPHLLKAIQELKAELDAAKARITALEA